eukprot:11185643-Karenia_brevis.AAC.1
MDVLDIPEVQVLVNFPDDAAGLVWHHRILLQKVGGGVWIAATPDGGLSRHNLLEMRHRVLERNSMFPADIRADCYEFDPVTRAQINAWKRLAKTQAAILNDDMVDELPNMVWIIAEPGHSKLGDTVPEADLALAPLGREKGVVEVDGVETFVLLCDSGQIAEKKKEIATSDADLRTL